MAKLLNIDTSSSICSVALAIDGEIVVGFESSKSMDHSTSLAPFVDKCLEYLRNNGLSLNAISVCSGPGSYTGLRIGLSLAKGLAFGLGIPLICISSLEILSVRAMFCDNDFNGNEIIVPMIDARRMEVYTAIYDGSLNLIKTPSPMILDRHSFEDIIGKGKILFIGDGSEKFKPLFLHENIKWLGNGMPHAKYMVNLSEKYYKENNFSDIAYSEPNYLKEYQVTQPKKKL